MNRCLFCIFLAGISSIPAWPAAPEKAALFGNRRTKDHVILRELNVKSALSTDVRALLKEKNWLLRLNYFRRVEMETRTSALWGGKTLLVLVQEKSPWTLDPILSENEPFGWIIGSQIAYTNLFGRRERISALFQFGAVRHFSLQWQEPWMLGALRLFSALEVYSKQFRYVYDDNPVHFLETDFGGRFTLGKAWGRQVLTGITGGMEQVDASDPSATLSGGKRDQTQSLEPFIQYDSRDWPVYPFSGLFCRAWKTWTGTASGRGFHRTGFDARFFAPGFHGQVIAFQAAGEFSEGDVPVVKRLHIGGSKTLRGLDNGSLSGECALFGTMEYRMPILFEKNDDTGFRFGYAAVVFADLGTAWTPRVSSGPDRWLGSAGFGFHGILDRLVLRLEWGTRGKGWGFITTGTGLKF